MVHASAVAEPTLVLAAGRYREAKGEYQRTVMLGQMGIALAASVLALGLTVVIAAAGQAAMATSFAGLALAAPPMLTLILLRRLAYARFRPALAAAGGALNLLLVVAALLWLAAGGRLGIVQAFAALAIASLVVCGLLWWALTVRNPFSRPWPIGREVAREHGRYARWGVPSGAIGWVPGNAYYLILPLLPGAAFGLQATASLRALANLIMPVLQGNAALGAVLIPTLSARQGRSQRPLLVPLVAFLVAASAAYGLLLVLFGERLVEWLYDGRYQATPVLLFLLGVIPVCTAVAHVLRGLTLSREQPERMFWSNLAAALASLVLGLPLVLAFGLAGVLVAIALGPAAQAVVLYGFVRASRRATRA